MSKVKSVRPRTGTSRKRKSKQKETPGPKAIQAQETQDRFRDILQVQEIYATMATEARLSQEKIRQMQLDLAVKVMEMWLDSWQQRQKVWNQALANWRKIMFG